MKSIPALPRPTAVIAAVVLALLAAACSASSSSTGSSGSSDGSANSQLVAYSQCMRSNGVPNFPDPAGGVPPKVTAQELGISSSQLQVAQGACQHLLPATGGSLSASSLQQCYLAGVCPQALVQQALSAGREFARCMRSHGVPNWPDPTIDSQGRPLFNIVVPRPPPAQVSTAMNECERLEPAGSLLAWG
ncbi:MAG: hypothetical protein WAL72_07580 [Streptosporangiaceae bacterium]